MPVQGYCEKKGKVNDEKRERPKEVQIIDQKVQRKINSVQKYRNADESCVGGAWFIEGDRLCRM